VSGPKPPVITQERIRSRIAAIRVQGELDLATVGELEGTVASAVERRQVPMLIDLSRCRFIDSSVLALLVDLRTNLQTRLGDSNARPYLAVVAEDQPLRVLRITGMDHQIPIFSSIPEALRTLDGPPAAEKAADADGSAGFPARRPAYEP
jgi:anti-anti-sigma factor